MGTGLGIDGCKLFEALDGMGIHAPEGVGDDALDIQKRDIQHQKMIPPMTRRM